MIPDDGLPTRAVSAKDERRAVPGTRWQMAATALLLALGVALRVTALDLGWFGVDQARDVATALDVARGADLPTVGPTMRRVVRLGALYYYVWAVPYLVSRDPLAGYWFAALLGVVAMVMVWRLAQRLWGRPAGLVVLATVAAHPVWVIDGRVAWAPALLPVAGAALLWLVLGREGTLSPRRATAIGATLGLAVQLHLTMVVWVAAVAVVALWERMPWRTVRRVLVGGLVTGLPALWAIAAPAKGQSGIGSLAARAALPAVGRRLAAAYELPWRVPAAFAQWGDRDAGGGAPVALAAAVLSIAVLAGLLCLAGRRTGHRRAARLILTTVVLGGVLVLGLPGDVWYYYLDALLPAAALAAGTLVTWGGVGARARVPVTCVVVGAAAVLGVHLGGWLRLVAERGYMPVEPALLTLDGRPGRDAATPGRLLTLRVKRAAAESVATLGGGFADLWLRTHGPAFGDASGDNGFWLRWALARQRDATVPRGGVAARHVALWYRSDPVAVALARQADGVDVAVTEVGPLSVVRYASAIDYASCLAEGVPITVPIRVLPAPRRYGDGTPPRPQILPRLVTCRLEPGGGSTRVVAALDGSGTVRVRGGGREATAGSESALCIARAPTGVTFTVEILPEGPAALDVYDLPLGLGCDPTTGVERSADARAAPDATPVAGGVGRGTASAVERWPGGGSGRAADEIAAVFARVL
jgi:Dolichyl-phosphate-mannose-protein mannosyltransferase